MNRAHDLQVYTCECWVEGEEYLTIGLDLDTYPMLNCRGHPELHALGNRASLSTSYQRLWLAVCGGGVVDPGK